MIEIISDAADISQAQASLVSEHTGGQKLVHTIGWQGGSVDLPTYWSETGAYWVAFSESDKRYWNAFGVQDPSATSGPLTVSVEINPPRNGLDRRLSGAFGRGEDGEVLLLHRGGVGGGGKGIGRKEFLHWARDSVEWARDGDRRSPVLVVGRIGDPELPQQIATFVDLVARFKKMVKAGVLTPASTSTGATFTPEFEGDVAVSPSVARTMRFRHGQVIRELGSELETRGYSTYNDHLRDLWLEATESRPAVLFEAKTRSDRQSIYTAVGQLSMYVPVGEEWLKVAVLPDEVPGPLAEGLNERGISVLRYVWEEGRPRFLDLEGVVAPVTEK